MRVRRDQVDIHPADFRRRERRTSLEPKIGEPLRSIRYLDVLTDPKISGPHRRVQSLAAGMVCEGHRPTVLLPAGLDSNAPFVSELTAAGVEHWSSGTLMQVRRPAMGTIAHNLRWLRNAVRFLRSSVVPEGEPFDCLVINGLLNTWMIIHPDFRGTPTILIVNDTIVPRSVFRIVVRLAGHRLRTVFQTPSVRCHYFPESPSTIDKDWSASLDIMPPGVDGAIYGFSGAIARGRRHGAFVLGSLCQVSSRKGVEDGIRCASALARRFPHRTIRFEVAGELLTTQQAYIDSLRRLASNAPPNCEVRFLGFLDRAQSADFLRSLDCMLLTSRSESFPQAVVQAQSVGTPVIAYAIPGLVDQVSHGFTGLLAEPFEVDNLVELAEQLMNERYRQEIVERARLQARAVFSLHANVQKFCRIVDDMRVRATA